MHLVWNCTKPNSENPARYSFHSPLRLSYISFETENGGLALMRGSNFRLATTADRNNKEFFVLSSEQKYSAIVQKAHTKDALHHCRLTSRSLFKY